MSDNLNIRIIHVTRLTLITFIIKENTSASVSNLDQYKNKFTKSVSDTIAVNGGQETTQLNAVNAVTDMAGVQMTGMDGSRSRLEASVREFVVSNLKKDVPTGATPGRIERTYPRFLAATSPHEKIIQRYVIYSLLLATLIFFTLEFFI